MDAHKNFAVSTVVTAPSPATSGTSLVVESGHGTRFPTPPFNASVYPADASPTPANAEIVRVTAIATDTLTITRAQESTTARSIATGDVIAATVTVKTITDIEALDLLSGLAAAEISVTGATTATIGRMHVCSGTTADYTVTLPAASGNAGKLIGFRMAPGLTKLVTLDGNGTEEIDGKTTRIMWAKESVILLCDGSAWHKIAGKSIPMYCRIARDTSSQSVNSATWTKVDWNATTYDNTAMMADLTNDRIVVKRPGTYRLAGQVGWNNLSGAARLISYIQVNSVVMSQNDAYQAFSSGNTHPTLQIPAIVTEVSTAGHVVEVFVYQAVGSAQNLRADATISMMEVSELITW